MRRRLMLKTRPRVPHLALMAAWRELAEQVARVERADRDSTLSAKKAKPFLVDSAPSQIIDRRTYLIGQPTGNARVAAALSGRRLP